MSCDISNKSEGFALQLLLVYNTSIVLVYNGLTKLYALFQLSALTRELRGEEEKNKDDSTDLRTT